MIPATSARELPRLHRCAAVAMAQDVVHYSEAHSQTDGHVCFSPDGRHLASEPALRPSRGDAHLQAAPWAQQATAKARQIPPGPVLESGPVLEPLEPVPELVAAPEPEPAAWGPHACAPLLAKACGRLASVLLILSG